MVRKQKVTVVLDNEKNIVTVIRGNSTRAYNRIKREAKIEAKEEDDEFIIDTVEDYRYEESYLED